MRTLYPALEPYRSRLLAVGRHRVYVEECGNPAGIPVLFLHGGPGSGCKPAHRRFFDPSVFRIVLVDQRGAGRSRPQGELRENSTQTLLSDLERIRREAAIGRWILFGGSWGAALALLYAEAHPERVLGMVLRGSFLARRGDLRWFIEAGAPQVYPDQWSRLTDTLPPAERGDVIDAIDRRLNGSDELTQRRMAREWTLWGNRVALGEDFDPEAYAEHVPASVLHQARIELHYAKHGYFVDEGKILRDCPRIASQCPITLIHGRRDLVCPVESSFTLSRLLPQAELRILPTAGHLATGDEMTDALVGAVDRMAANLH